MASGNRNDQAGKQNGKFFIQRPLFAQHLNIVCQNRRRYADLVDRVVEFHLVDVGKACFVDLFGIGQVFAR